jgi:hypothetical protein
MPNVCDFALPNNVGDGELQTSMLMPANQRKLVFDLTLPPGAKQESRSIVSFLLHTTDADDLQFQVKIGGHAKKYTVNSDNMRVVQEIVGPGTLNVTQLDHNSVTFEPLSGDGVLGISDVVLWFQRTI